MSLQKSFVNLEGSSSIPSPSVLAIGTSMDPTTPKSMPTNSVLIQESQFKLTVGTNLEISTFDGIMCAEKINN